MVWSCGIRYTAFKFLFIWPSGFGLLTLSRFCSGFAATPHDHMFVIAQLILDVATADINKADDIRTTLKDIWDIRQSKLRSVVTL